MSNTISESDEEFEPGSYRSPQARPVKTYHPDSPLPHSKAIQQKSLKVGKQRDEVGPPLKGLYLSYGWFYDYKFRFTFLLFSFGWTL